MSNNKVKSMRTRKIMETRDIEGWIPNYYINKFQKRNPLKTDDIDGAMPPKIPGYSGKRPYQNFINSAKDGIGDSISRFNEVWFDKPLIDKLK